MDVTFTRSCALTIAVLRYTLLCLICLPPLATSAQPSYQKRWFTMQDGLAHDYVYCLLEDRSGFMWFGTRNGLCRFDGHEFRTYRHKLDDSNSIPNNVVNVLAEDPSGTLWIGTYKGGLSSFDRAKGTFQRHGLPKELQLHGLNTPIRGLCIDSSGRVWVRTSVARVGRYDPRTKAWTCIKDPFSEQPPDLVTSGLKTISTGQIIFLTTTGITTIEPESGRQRFLPLASRFVRTAPNRLENSVGTSHMVELPSGEVLIQISSDLVAVTLSTGRIRSLASVPSPPNILATVLVNDTTLILGTDIGLDVLRGSIIRDGSTTRPVRDSLLRNAKTFALTEDRYGRIWAGTATGVVVTWRSPRFLRSWVPRIKPDHLPHGIEIRSMSFTDDTTLLVGTASGTIHALNTSSFKSDVRFNAGELWRQIDARSPSSATAHSPLQSITQVRSGDLLLGTLSAGCIVLDKYYRPRSVLLNRDQHFKSPFRSRKLSALESQTFAVSQGDEGSIFIGSQSTQGRLAVSELTEDYDQHHVYELGRNAGGYPLIWSIIRTTPGMFAVCTTQGLYTLDPARQIVQEVQGTSSLVVVDMVRAKSGTWYCSTLGNGVLEFDANAQTILRGVINTDLPDTDIYSMVCDDQGFLWLATDRGLVRYDETSRTVLRFGLDDGLVSTTFLVKAADKGTDGTLYFGTNKGLVICHPQYVPLDRSQAPVTVTSLTIGGYQLYHYVPNGSNIQVPQSTSAIQLEFASLDFMDKERVMYRYRLLGYDTAWITTGERRFASILNLEPGSYTLELEASDRLGKWVHSPYRMGITVHPALWAHPATRATGLAVGLVLVGGFIVRRRRRSARMLRSLQEARDAERRNLAASLHDGPMQELYGVRFVIDGKKTLNAEEIERVDTLTKLARKEIGELCGELRVDTRIERFSFAVEGVVDKFASLHKGLVVDVDIDRSLDNVWISDVEREALLAVLRTSLINVANHAEAHQCMVRVWKHGTKVYLELLDDGRGLDANNEIRMKEYRGNGLILCRAYAACCGGTFGILGRESGGTAVSFTTAGSWHRLFNASGKPLTDDYKRERI